MTAVLTAVLIMITQQQLPSPAPSHSGPPAKVAFLKVEKNDLVSTGWIFADEHHLSQADLAALNSANGMEATDQWLRNRGAVDPDEIQIKLVLQGNRENTVRILGIQPKKRCQPPLDGTLFTPGQAGADDSIAIGFDLDKENPRAQTYEPGYPEGAWKGDYFAEKTQISADDLCAMIKGPPSMMRSGLHGLRPHPRIARYLAACALVY